MSQQECRDQLLDLMRAQNECIVTAHSRLDEIGQALSENKIDSLQRSLVSPDLGFEQLQQLEHQRHALLQRYGFETDAAAQTACIDWCDDANRQLASLNRDLVANLQSLQRSIQLNNILVGKGRDRIRRSIGILTGQERVNQCKTYSSSGKTEQGPGQRDIAIA